MRINHAACIPLLVQDPYISVWSGADHANDKDTQHWSGLRQRIYVDLIAGGKCCRLVGSAEGVFETGSVNSTADRKTNTVCKTGEERIFSLPQTALDVTATKTTYTYEGAGYRVFLSFLSPLLPKDLVLLSRPCTYIDARVERTGIAAPESDAGKVHPFSAETVLTGGTVSDVSNATDAGNTSDDSIVSLRVTITRDLVSRDPDASLVFPAGRTEQGRFVSMGRAEQHPLGNSGDNITIDWGYAYLAVKDNDDRSAGAVLTHDAGQGTISARVPFRAEAERDPGCAEDQEGAGQPAPECATAHVLFAYDDLVSINYFGSFRRAYWTKIYPDILAAIDASLTDRRETAARAAAFDAEVEEKAMAAGGKAYQYVCDLSCRQSIAAHKLITDEEGNVVFLSKENDSNGCIGTVDVSYPSVPLYLWQNPELVKGMLRPVFRFAASRVWSYDFAPHDVGRYPYAWGQVYGLKRELKEAGKEFCADTDGAVFPPLFQYRGDDDLYDFHDQMPVEECGNMLIMTAAVSIADGNADFALPYLETLRKWEQYLLQYGEDPAEQLCTDDFAGHLSHNTNLSVKAIMGIEAYSRICRLAGRTAEAAKAHAKAAAMAQSWEQRAVAGDHYSLVFGKPETWSLKYNMVWDRIFGSDLFSAEIPEKEINWYLTKQNEFGVPLDSRKDYTKSDWILWTAAQTEDHAKREKLIGAVAHYLETTPSRYPFSDWYDSRTGAYCQFKGRSVQGGIFMPIYADQVRR